MATTSHRRLSLDGWYKWLVVAASFLLQAVIGCTIFTAGSFFMMLRENLQGSEWLLSTVFSLNIGISYFICPVAGVLIERVGCRPVVLVGGLIGSLGILLSTFITEIWQLLITFGIIAGTGIGLCYIPAIAIIGQYFPPKTRTLAMGIAVCGVGAGGIVFPKLLRWMEEAYAWRGAMLLTTGVALQTLVAAFIFRQPDVVKAGGDEGGQSSLSGADKEQEVTASPPGAGESGQTSQQEDHILQEGENHSEIMRRSQQDMSSSPDAERIRGLYLKFSSSMCNNIGFNLFLLLNVLYTLGISVVLIHIGACGISHGFSVDQGTMLVFTLNIGSTVSRPVYGLMAQVPCIGAARAMAMGLSLCGLATIVYPFSINFAMMAAFSTLIGLFHGSFASLPPIVTIDLVGVDRLASGYGYVCVADGVGMMVGGAVSGWLYNTMGNYNLPFVVAGIIELLAGICGAIIRTYYYTGQLCWNHKHKQSVDQNLDL